MIDRGMVYEQTIKYPLHIFLRTLPPACYIFSDIILGLLDEQRLKNFQTLNIYF